MQNVVKFFNKKLLGFKSLEFRIWSRTLKFKKDYTKLSKIQTLIKKIRS